MILLGACQDLVPDATGFDVMITDPPYSPHVHKSAVSQAKVKGVTKRDFGFDPLSDPLRAQVCAYTGQVRRWSVIYSDIESTQYLRDGASGKYIRTLSWIRWSMPQLSGDRPPSCREDLLIFHREEEDNIDLALFYGSQKGRKAWNGAGNLDCLRHKCLRGDGKHKTEKPLDQALDLVSWFSDPGEVVFDPFAGSGTIGLACKILGREYVGVELDPGWAEFAQQRIAAWPNKSKRDEDRYGRWQATQVGQ